MTQNAVEALNWLFVVAGPILLVVGMIFGILRLVFRKRTS